jgi:multidrug resistance efflux pump
LALRRSIKDSYLAKLESTIARMDQQIRQLEKKRRETKQLVDEKLAPPAGLKDLQSQLAVLYKERSTYIGELDEERALFRENLDILEENLGQPVSSGNIPEEANLVAPMDGYVVWVSEQLRPGAKLNQGTIVVYIGVMDPMILLAQVHEIEALKLKIGNRAEFTPESMPDRLFECRITRISWAPVDARIDQPSYYQVEFDLPNPDLVLKEGQKGNIRFIDGP